MSTCMLRNAQLLCIYHLYCDTERQPLKLVLLTQILLRILEIIPNLL